MRISVCFFAAVFLTACQRASPSDPFMGTWALKVEDQNIIILSLKPEGGRIGGTMTLPETMQIDGEGSFESISSEHYLGVVTGGSLSSGELRFSVSHKGKDQYGMKLVDPNHAEVRPADTPAWISSWKFERTTGESLTLASELPKRKPATPEIAALQANLKAMSEADQAVRNEKPIFARRVQAVDQKHLPEILRIYAQHGWPRQSLVGKEAATQFWLLVQHQEPELQRKLLPDLERLAAEGEARPQDFALLYDRVLKGQGKLQRWGTQASCTEGKVVLDPVEDPDGLDQRRREQHLNPIEDYLRELESSCRNFVDDLPKSK